MEQHSSTKRPLQAELPSPKRRCQHTEQDEQDDDDDDIGFLTKLLREGEEQQQQQSFSSHLDQASRHKQDEEEEEDTSTPHGHPTSKTARVQSILHGLNHQQHDDDEEEEEHQQQKKALVTAAAAAALAAVPFRRPQTYNDNDLFRSLQLMDFESAQALLEHDPELTAMRDEDLAQPLAVAVEARFEKAVKYLLHLGCPLQEVDGRGFSALHIAVEAFGDMPFLLRFLLQYTGSNIDARAPPVVGLCPLHLAADERVLKLLLGCGADPSVRVPVPAGRKEKGEEEVEVEEEDVLGRLERTWPRGKGKKKARFLLTRLSPYQSYMLAKLRFIAHMYTTTTTSSSSSSFFLRSFTHTARAKIIGARLDEKTELLDLQKEEEEEAQADIWCREEVKGQVFSFVENGRLYLARSRSMRPDYPPPLTAASSASSSSSLPLSLPPPAAAAAAAAAAVAETVVDDSNSREKKEGTGNTRIFNLEEANLSPPRPAGMCPLSVLKAARADIFLVGEYKEEGGGEGNPSPDDGSGSNSSSSSKNVKEEEWVLLPALPRVEIFGRKEEEEEEEGGEGGREDVPAAVLRALVYEAKDERVLLALQALLWTGGGKRG